MKKLFLLLLFSIGAYASDFNHNVQPGSTNPMPVISPLQQDLINNASNYQSTRTFGYVFGRNTAVQNVRCDVWEGPTCVYVFPAVAQQMAVSSSSANDASNGTGCRQIEIHYLDGSYLAHVEVVNTNGVTPVNTVATNILRVNGMHCISTGSGGAAAGNISLKNTGATVTYDYITAGYNAARQAIYTVPAGVNGYISHWQSSSGAASGSHFTIIDIRATQHEGVLTNSTFVLVDEVGTLNNGFAITLPIPIRIPATTDVKMSAISDAANANAVVTGAIMGWFETQ